MLQGPRYQGIQVGTDGKDGQSEFREVGEYKGFRGRAGWFGKEGGGDVRRGVEGRAEDETLSVSWGCVEVLEVLLRGGGGG